MRIIGLDPGVARLGYAVLELPDADLGQFSLGSLQPQNLLGCGIISTTPKEPPWKRLRQIAQDLDELLGRYWPEVAVVELLYFSQNTKTALAVAQARGVVLERLAYHQIDELGELTPTQVKQVLTGQGHANKATVQEAVRHTLGLARIIQPDDAADAVALILAYLLGKRGYC